MVAILPKKGRLNGHKTDTWAKTTCAMSHDKRVFKTAAKPRPWRMWALVVALALLGATLMEVGAIPGLGMAFRLATLVDTIYQAGGGRALLPRATELPLGTLMTLRQAEAAAAAANVTFYTVRSGDTLSRIAVQHGLSLNTILQANGLDLKAIIRPGQKIAIPGADGAMYVVRAGDSLWEIARQMGSDVQSIKQANSLSSNIIYPGQTLVVPGTTTGGTRVTTASVGGTGASSSGSAGTATTGASTATGSSTTTGPTTSAGSSATYRYDAVNPGSVGVSGAGLIWPVYGGLTSLFEWRWGRMHTGIDIAAPSGTGIRAAADGTVIYSGWLGGYGQAVQIRHADGKVTLYGHASILNVKTGNQVKQGQIIANVGSTGNSTGPHLHFEVMVGGSYKDPLAYLATKSLSR